MEFKIEKCEYGHAYNVKREKRNNERNETAQSR